MEPSDNLEVRAMEAVLNGSDVDLERAFTYHPPTPETLPRFEAVRHHAKFLAYLFMQAVPDIKERTIAINMVESAVMWANAGIARNTIQVGVGEPPPFVCHTCGKTVDSEGSCGCGCGTL